MQSYKERKKGETNCNLPKIPEEGDEKKESPNSPNELKIQTIQSFHMGIRGAIMDLEDENRHEVLGESETDDAAISELGGGGDIEIHMVQKCRGSALNSVRRDRHNGDEAEALQALAILELIVMGNATEMTLKNEAVLSVKEQDLSQIATTEN